MRSNIISVPERTYFELSDICNLNCKHCYNNIRASYLDFHDESKIIEALDKILINEASSNIRFGGGEPLLVPYIFNILEYLKDKNIPATLTTNATLITDSIAKRLFDCGVRNVTVSLDGLEKNNDYIRGPDIYKKTIANIKSLINAGIAVSFGTTINGINYKEIDQIIEVGKDIGVFGFNFFRYIPFNNTYQELNLDKRKLLVISQKLLNARANQDHRYKILYERFGFFSFLLDKRDNNATCQFISGRNTITSEGNLVVCHYINKYLGNIWKESLKQIIKNYNATSKEMLFIPKECYNCDYAEICRGGCKGPSYVKYNDFQHKDECCFKDL